MTWLIQPIPLHRIYTALALGWKPFDPSYQVGANVIVGNTVGDTGSLKFVDVYMKIDANPATEIGSTACQNAIAELKEATYRKPAEKESSPWQP